MNRVAISNDNRYIISGSNDCSIKIWERETSILFYAFKGHNAAVTCIVISNNDNYIISGSMDN